MYLLYQRLLYNNDSLNLYESALKRHLDRFSRYCAAHPYMYVARWRNG